MTTGRVREDRAVRRRPDPTRAPLTVPLRLPVGNVLVVEIAVGVALVVLAVDVGWWPLALAVAVLGVMIAAVRRHGRWLTEWCVVMTAFHARSRHRTVVLAPAGGSLEPPDPGSTPVDGRLALLRLLLPDLVVARGTDHRHQPIAFAWHGGTCTAVLAVETGGDLVQTLGPSAVHVDATPDARTPLPLRALADCMEQRGLVLDGIQVVSRSATGATARTAAADAAYRQVLGVLPAVARRSTWIGVRLDPGRCPTAVEERGGGTPGTHRALLAAVARVQSVLEREGLVARVLDHDELLHASLSCAELTRDRGAGNRVHLRERWRSVSAGGIGHRSYAITGWPTSPGAFDALTALRARSTTLALSLTSGADDRIGLQGVLRVSGAAPSDLGAAGEHLCARSADLGVVFTPLDGQQEAALGRSLPLSGTA